MGVREQVVKPGETLPALAPKADLQAPQGGPTVGGLNRGQVDLIKRSIAPDATDDELAMFIETCNSLGLNPFAKEIYFTKYKNRQTGVAKVAIITGIDGCRKFAQRSANTWARSAHSGAARTGNGKRSGWTQGTKPAAAKVGVLGKGDMEPTWGIVTWAEFGKAENLWLKIPAHMLAKVAEKAALAQALPACGSGHAPARRSH